MTEDNAPEALGANVPDATDVLGADALDTNNDQPVQAIPIGTQDMLADGFDSGADNALQDNHASNTLSGGTRRRRPRTNTPKYEIWWT